MALCSACFLSWDRRSFSAVFFSRTPCCSRLLRLAAVVARFSAGVAPSNTKTGLILWYSSLQILRKKPKTCAFLSCSPFSSRMAFMNWISQIDASTATLRFESFSTFTRFPHGSSRVHRPCTPIAARPHGRVTHGHENGPSPSLKMSRQEFLVPRPTSDLAGLLAGRGAVVPALPWRPAPPPRRPRPRPRSLGQCTRLPSPPHSFPPPQSGWREGLVSSRTSS